MTGDQALLLDKIPLDALFSYLLDRLGPAGKDAHNSVTSRPRYLARYGEALVTVPIQSIHEGAITPEQLRYALVRILHLIQVYFLGRRKHSAGSVIQLLLDREAARREQEESEL